MKVRVNGEDMDIEEGTTVESLLRRLGVNTRGVAVERNGEIVPRTRHSATVLEEGDSVEIVRMVGGG